MGAFFSKAEENSNASTGNNQVNELYKRGACVQCIARILSISRFEIETYNLNNIHSENCFICRGISSHIEDMKQSILKAIDRYSFHDIQIEIDPKLLKNDNKLMQRYNCQTSCSLKNYLKGKILLTIIKCKEGPILQVKINSSTNIQSELKWPPLYIVGRYMKRSRRVSNTRFMKGEHAISSVEKELINALCPQIRCTERKFLSAGREDMDVRMIGSGRPFSITLNNPLPNEDAPPPKNFEEFAQSYAHFLPKEIDCNYCVSAVDLRITADQPDISPKMEKCYRCVVSCSRNITVDDNLKKLDQIENLTISQKTPCRVAHRRILAYREKTVFSLKYQQMCPRFFILDLRTSKGTYIKEFVNSDFGRTKPSLGELLDPENPVECQLLQLDVIRVGDF